MKYMMFTENNEWEGETWNFFIPIEGNEAVIEKIRKLIRGNSAYELGEPVWTQSEVEKLLRKPSRTDYINEFNLVSAVNDLPDTIDWERDNDPFYKGKAFKVVEE